MSWASLIVTSLGILSTLMKWAADRKAIDAAEEIVIAKATMELLQQTEEGKKLRELVRNLDDVEADELWDRMVK